MITDYTEPTAQAGQYDAWDETINPPKLWHCRDCNGMGYDPYTWPCQVCEETGTRWPWLRRLKKFFRSIPSPMFYCRCHDCKKVCWILGFGIGKHDDCIPF